MVRPQELLLDKITKLNESGLFKETFLTAAIDGDRVDELKVFSKTMNSHNEIFQEYLMQRAVARDWLFDKDIV